MDYALDYALVKKSIRRGDQDVIAWGEASGGRD
jgi:hypothetical protein